MRLQSRDKVTIGTLGTFIATLLLVVGWLSIEARPQVSLESVSPDGKSKIIIREGARRIDRNFTVVLIDTNTDLESILFQSFDQSPTIKAEKFIWSLDSSKVALIGDSYYAVPNSELSNGDTLFLLVDFETNTIWCNTDHERQECTSINASEATEILGGKDAFSRKLQ